MTRRPALYVVDGHSNIFRAYHAMEYLSTSRGQPTHAILILSTMLWKLIREEQPEYLAIALDPPGPTFRDKLFAEYKATRTSMPSDLARQLPYIRRLFDALRTPVLEVPGYEADDVLATLVEHALKLTDLDVVLVTGDKDLLQLVGPRVRVLSVVGRTGEKLVYVGVKVRERWGVGPDQIPDVMALMGDSIDNVPGVKGVGEKTAVKLIGQYGSVARLYDNLTLIPGKLRETLAVGRKHALLSRELVVLSRGVPFVFALAACRRGEPDWPQLRGLWLELEFTRLVKELPAAAPAADAGPVTVLPAPRALADWVAHVPAGAPVLLDWAGDPRPPTPRIDGLGVFQPDAGAAGVALGGEALGDLFAAGAPVFGGHPLVAHDARPLVPVLAEMERTGIRVDPARLEAFAKELERDLDNLTREIYALAGEEFTIASPKQLAQILFEKLKLPILRRTKTGPSTDADVLSELALGHALPGKILEHRSLAKLKGTYADTLPGLVNPETGRIHTTFNQLVASTGRLSSQDPNLMNIPIRTELGRRIRAAFIPAQGWTFVAADYSQIELRILAHMSAEPAIIESFRRGEDIHRRTASERMAMNAPVQGTASDMIKTAMVRIRAALVERGLKARMLLQVHDELLFEAPRAEVPAVEALAREIMEAALPLDVPIVVDVKSGDDWSQV